MKKEKHTGEYSHGDNVRRARKVLEKTKKEHSKYNWRTERFDSRTVRLVRNGRKDKCKQQN